MVVCVAAIGVGGFLYFTKLELANAAARRRLQPRAPTAGRAVAVRRAVASAGDCRRPSPPASAAAAAIAAAALERKVRGRDTCRSSADRARAVARQRICSGQPTTRRFALNHQSASRLRRSGSRAKRPPRARRSNSARSAPTPRSRRATARSTRSATTSFTRMAGRRCRRCHGSGAIPRPNGRLWPRTCRWCATPARRRLESAYVPAARSQGGRDRPGRPVLLSTSDGETVEDGRARTLESCGAIAGVALHDRGRRRHLRGPGADA